MALRHCCYCKEPIPLFRRGSSCEDCNSAQRYDVLFAKLLAKYGEVSIVRLSDWNFAVYTAQGGCISIGMSVWDAAEGAVWEYKKEPTNDNE